MKRVVKEKGIRWFFFVKAFLKSGIYTRPLQKKRNYQYANLYYQHFKRVALVKGLNQTSHDTS